MTLQDYMHMRGPAADERIPYGKAPSQFVEFFRPSGRGPYPVVVVVHGGCWVHKFQGLRQVAGMAKAFAEHGFAVYSIEYRGIDESGGGFPGTYEDISAALAVVQDQAQTRHLNLDRLIGVGHSAGAHLMLWAAGRKNIPVSSVLFNARPLRISAVIGLGALPNLSNRSGIHDVCGIDSAVLTGAPGRPEPLRDTSPAAMLPLDTSKIVLINGSLDTVSAPAVVAAFASQARQAGNAVRVVEIPAATHYDEISTTSPVWAQLLRIVQTLPG
ncbi:alpha/beta hydrolase family protein [Caballeronia glebae]|nr:alpha/beta hydrolase [Caballeronia glebae]